MESLLNQSRAMCPFLKRTSPATLRSLSTSTRPSSSPGGGTISNLQVIARRCPVMSKALAVQSARLAGAKRFTSSAAGVPSMRSLREASSAGRKGYHTTGKNPASVNPGTYEKARGEGMFVSCCH